MDLSIGTLQTLIPEARERVASEALRTPLVPFRSNEGSVRVFLKLETLQPFSSYKIRGVANTVKARAAQELHGGLITASAGNMAQSVAFLAKRMGLRCTALVPQTAPDTKKRAIESLGARLVELPFQEVWEVVRVGRPPEAAGPGFLIHPAFDPWLVAGHGTIGLEILEDMPDVDAVVVPFGVGGLALGIAAALRLMKPAVKVYACEVETASPLDASFREGRAMAIDRKPSFVDGIGTPEVLPRVWELASKLLNGSIVVPLAEVEEAVRALYSRHRIIAEGAGATALAAAARLSRKENLKVAAVISGGNLEFSVLAKILSGF